MVFSKVRKMSRKELIQKRQINKFNHFEWREFGNTGLMYQHYFDAGYFRIKIKSKIYHLRKWKLWKICQKAQCKEYFYNQLIHNQNELN